MKLVYLDKDIFDHFANNHRYRTFQQTSEYGDLMEKNGFQVYYLGFLNNAGSLVGATLLLYQKAFWFYKYGYAPSGFLMDYTDYDTVHEITIRLRKFLHQNHFIFFRIDPPIHCSKRDRKGNIISYNPEINNIMEILQASGYQHKGFNSFFEGTKARFNAVVELHTTNEKLLQTFSKQTRNKIHKADKSGVTVYKASISELPIFYEFIKRKYPRKIEYYREIMECFGSDAELYLAKIDAHKFVSNTKNAYEKALLKSDDLSAKLQSKNTKGKDVRKIINRKMEADKVFAQEQGNLGRATQLFQVRPEGIVIGGALVLKKKPEVFLFIEGFDQKYRSFNPNYYLKWYLVQKFNKENYQYFNLNAIVGEFQEKNKYSGLNEMKLGFASSSVEYIGEFDYIINPYAYRSYLKRCAKKKKRTGQ